MTAVLDFVRNNGEAIAFASLTLNGLFAVFVFLYTHRYKKVLESIRFSHARDIESLRKEHSLEIEKRKRLYEDKARQYQDYAAKMDSFQQHVGSDAIDEFGPVYERFLSQYLAAIDAGSDEAQSQAIVQFSEGVQRLAAKYHKEYQALKSATNRIKLVAGPLLLEALEDLDRSYDEAFRETTSIMKEFSALQSLDENELAGLRERSVTNASSSESQHHKVLAEMRKELDDI